MQGQSQGATCNNPEEFFIMSCNGSTTHGPSAVWTNKTNDTWLFHPLCPAESAMGMNFVRITMEVGQSSGLIKARPCVRYSDDGVTWGGAATIDATNMTQTNDGTKYGTWIDIQSGQKNFAQFGVEVTDSSGTATELANVTLRIDRKS